MKLYIPDRAFEGNVYYTWAEYKKIFALANISVDSIIDIQREQIKLYSINDNESLKWLNAELFQPLNEDFSEAVERQVVDNIENNFQGLRKRFEEAQANGIDFNDELNRLINSYQEIINRVGGIQNMNYQELDAIGKSMYKLQNDINLLKSWMSSSESGHSFSELASLRIADQKNEKAHFVTKRVRNAPSLIRQLAGIGTALKGLQLEQLATEKLANRIPDMEKLDKDLAAVNTGSIRVNIGGGASVDIKEDISIFDLTFDQQIELVNGEKISLKELISRLGKNESVTVSQTGYETLQMAMVTAVSAKSTQSGKKIQLHAGLTTDRILAEVKSYDTAYWALKHMRQLKMANSSFRGSKDYNTMLINYNMSKMLTKIIGLKNDFLVTKEGFVPMEQFLDDQLKMNHYASVSPASLDGPMAVQI